MSIDTRRDPSLAYTYNGFTGPQAPAPPQEVPPWRRPKALAIAASACAVGLALGVWAKPQFGPDGRAREPMKPVSAQPLDGAMQIVVDPGKAQPAPAVATAGAPLEVLPADMAAAAARNSVVQGPSPAPRISVPEPDNAALVAPPALPRVTEVRRPAVDRVRPSFDCRSARTRAEEMVCQDPALAAADRRLAQAFRRATEAGVPYRELRGEQDDWLSIREAAARRSPEAVASIYDQRTEELEAMSDEAWDE